MTNADKFKSLFGLYATELWAMPEKDFLKWLNSEAMNCSEFPNNSDTISRQAAIDVLKQMRKDGNLIPWEGKKVFEAIRNLPSAQPETATVTIGRTRGGITMWYKCDACDEPVDQNDNYCRNCGRKLKHE